MHFKKKKIKILLFFNSTVSPSFLRFLSTSFVLSFYPPSTKDKERYKYFLLYLNSIKYQVFLAVKYIISKFNYF